MEKMHKVKKASQIHNVCLVISTALSTVKLATNQNVKKYQKLSQTQELFGFSRKNRSKNWSFVCS